VLAPKAHELIDPIREATKGATLPYTTINVNLADGRLVGARKIIVFKEERREEL
jgi:hypothetical protein